MIVVSSTELVRTTFKVYLTSFTTPHNQHNLEMFQIHKQARSCGNRRDHMGHQDQDGEKVGQMSLFF